MSGFRWHWQNRSEAKCGSLLLIKCSLYFRGHGHRNCCTLKSFKCSPRHYLRCWKWNKSNVNPPNPLSQVWKVLIPVWSVQRSAKVGIPGLVIFVTAVAYHFCPTFCSMHGLHATWCIDLSRFLYCCRSVLEKPEIYLFSIHGLSFTLSFPLALARREVIIWFPNADISKIVSITGSCLILLWI